MRADERFIGFIQWPTSRKVVLLGGISLLATLAAVLVNRVAQSGAGSSLVSVGLLQRFVLAWLLAQIVVTLINVPAARRGREGRLGAYVFIAVQAFFSAGLMYLYGTMGSPLVALGPALVILWTFYLDERLGGFGLVCLAFWVLLTGYLEISGRLPHAPVLIARSIDAQASLRWFGTMFAFMLILLTTCLSLSVLALSTRRLQEARLRGAHEALARVNRLMCRYVPAQLADQIIAGDYSESARPKRRYLTIVFSDVEGFTSASDELDPEGLAAALDEYLSEMLAIADRHGATVNQIVGDGLMLFFGAPQVTNDRDHALRAVRMALEMQQRMSELQQIWMRHGLLRPFRIRIGINSGFASVGDFGSAGRKLYSGIGLQTNLAARIESVCRPGRVLISHSTWTLLQGDIACDPKPELMVKGVNYPLKVYEVRPSHVTEA